MKEFNDLKALSQKVGIHCLEENESQWILAVREQTRQDPCLKAQFRLAFDLKITPLQEREEQLLQRLSRQKPETWYWEVCQCFNHKLSLNSTRYNLLQSEKKALGEDLFYWKALKREARRLKLI